MTFSEACILLSALLLTCGCQSRNPSRLHDQQATRSPSTGSASSTGPAQQQWSPSAYADRLAQFMGDRNGNGTVYFHETEVAVRETVNRDICSGFQDSVADFIVAKGWWAKKPWYRTAAEEFTHTWYERRYPITVAATPKTVAVLEKLARSRVFGRELRVEAATLLLPMKKELAKTALEEEYANFEIHEFSGFISPDGETTPAPHATGFILSGIDIVAPDEVTTIEDLKKIMLRGDFNKPIDEKRLVPAANRFNKRLRELFLKKDNDELWRLGCYPGYPDLAIQCYEESSEPATKPATGGIFGSTAPATGPAPTRQKITAGE